MAAGYTDPDHVHRAWRDQEDIERGEFLARQLMDEAITKDLPFDVRLALVAAAAEPLFDGPHRNPMLVYAQLNVLAKIWKYEEAKRPTTLAERTANRTAINVYRGRALHCGGDSRRGFEQAWSGHTHIEKLAGGREGLLNALASPEPNLAAECMIATFGIFAATLKRAFPVHSPTRLYWLDEMRAMVDSYIPALDADRAILYPGSPSMIQVMYLLIEQGDPADAARITALRNLDLRARPADARARATVPLREIALARYLGDAEAVERLSPLALSALQGSLLRRHLVVVVNEDYLGG